MRKVSRVWVACERLLQLTGDLANLFRVPRFMRGQEAGPLIHVQRAKARMLVDDAAEREAIGARDEQAERRARRFGALPRDLVGKPAGPRRLGPPAPFAAVGRPRPHLPRQQRGVAVLRAGAPPPPGRG